MLVIENDLTKPLNLQPGLNVAVVSPKDWQLVVSGPLGTLLVQELQKPGANKNLRLEDEEDVLAVINHDPLRFSSRRAFKKVEFTADFWLVAHNKEAGAAVTLLRKLGTLHVSPSEQGKFGTWGKKNRRIDFGGLIKIINNRIERTGGEEGLT